MMCAGSAGDPAHATSHANRAGRPFLFVCPQSDNEKTPGFRYFAQNTHGDYDG